MAPPAPKGAGGLGSSASTADPRLPCTILSGLMGAGKTTLLTHILHNTEGLRCAVIVHNMADLNLDASLIKKSGTPNQAEEVLLQLTNGCTCCTLRGDLAEAVGRLAATGLYDCCVIESTGDPKQVAETFAMLVGKGGPPLSDVARVDTCVTLVDAASLMANLASVGSRRDLGQQAGEGEDCSVCELLVDQIEFADVLLLNKVHLVSPDEQRRLLGLLHALNPGADLLPTSQSEIPLARLIQTGRFSSEEALQGGFVPETDEHDVGSLVYRARRPFHPARLHAFLTTHFLLQEPDWSEALVAQGDEEVGLRGSDSSHKQSNGQQLENGHAARQAQQALAGPVHAAVLHASEAAAQAASALQLIVQQQAGVAGGSGSAQQQALLATLAAATSAAAAAASAAAILLTQLQGDAGSSSSGALSLPESQQAAPGSSSATYHHHPSHRREEAAVRQARLASSCGQLLRSKGVIWLATRPNLCGEWSQAGGILRLGVGGPWYAALPRAQEEAAQAKIQADFQAPHGDRRQEISLIGIRLNGKALFASLDSCLVSDTELAAAAAAGSLHDPFMQWPTLEQILTAEGEAEGAEEESEEEDFSDSENEAVGEEGVRGSTLRGEEGKAGVLHSTLSGIEEGTEEGEEEDGSGFHVGVLHNITYGAAEMQECFDDAAQQLGGGSNTTSTSISGSSSPGMGVVSWHAAWCEPCQSAAGVLRQLAPRYASGAAFFCMDVEGSSANTALALEKVMRKAEARRRGAKPLLKSGNKFPCITVHHLPSMQPVHMLTGADAIDQLQQLLHKHAAEAAPAAGAPAAVSPTAAPSAVAAAAASPTTSPPTPTPAAVSAAAPPPAASAAPSRLVVLRRGASEAKELLSAGRASGCPVLIVWTHANGSSGGGGEQEALQTAVAEAAACTSGLTLVHADAGASASNQVLAGALKVKTFPEVHVYRDMKLEIKLSGGSATPAELAALAARLVASAASSSSPPLPTVAVAAPAAPVVAASVVAAPAAVAEAVASSGGTNGSPFDPPASKFAKPGAVKRFPDDSLGYFFPKMPCLRCGCPWWSSEEWDARCQRCQWDCESGGYDNDSQPLPKHKQRWDKYVAMIKEGRTPAWAPKAGSSSAPPPRRH